MKVYKKLYVSTSAQKDKKKILRGLEKKELQPGIYALTLPAGRSDLLDIIPAFTLKYPIFKDARVSELYLVGIARGKTEAFELAAKIVEDTIAAGKAYDIPGALKFGQDR